MPQTYFVMPALVFIQKLPFSLPKSFTIVLSILFGVLPLASWILYMMSSRKIAELQEMCALDRLGSVHSWVRIFNEIRVDMILVFLLSWSIAWGNYLVPYSLGSRDSFTSVVQITTFTSNLGRDWAMICAAGFIVCIPGVIIGSVLVGVFFRKDQ
jgi:ABC-type glycerol-3-phosphate transport system permease component